MVGKLLLAQRQLLAPGPEPFPKDPASACVHAWPPFARRKYTRAYTILSRYPFVSISTPVYNIGGKKGAMVSSLAGAHRAPFFQPSRPKEKEQDNRHYRG